MGKTTYKIYRNTKIYLQKHIYIYERERENRKSKQQKERGTTPQIGQTT